MISNAKILVTDSSPTGKLVTMEGVQDALQKAEESLMRRLVGMISRALHGLIQISRMDRSST